MILNASQSRIHPEETQNTEQRNIVCKEGGGIIDAGGNKIVPFRTPYQSDGIQVVGLADDINDLDKEMLDGQLDNASAPQMLR